MGRESTSLEVWETEWSLNAILPDLREVEDHHSIAVSLSSSFCHPLFSSVLYFVFLSFFVFKKTLDFTTLAPKKEYLLTET